MEPKELPKNIDAKVSEWLHEHSVLHFWECDGTFLVIARVLGDIYCLRIFPIGDKLELSQDHVIFGG